MDKQVIFKGVFEAVLAALAAAVFSLFALAIAALFVRGFLLPQTAVTAIDWSIRCVAVFLGSLFLIGKERALFKGMGAGIMFCFLTLLLFGLIGGNWQLDIFFLLELVVCIILGGVGALVGAKLRKA